MADEPDDEVDADVDRAWPTVDEEPSGRRSWSVLQWVLVSLGAFFVVAGLLAVGAIVLLVVGMNQWASNK
jgi:hypothetical protein